MTVPTQMIVGKAYKFKSQSDFEIYQADFSLNNSYANVIGVDGKFKILAGKHAGEYRTDSGQPVIGVTEIEINGTPFSNRGSILICADEIRFFEEVTSTEDTTESNFMSAPMSKMIDLFKHYHPTASNSKITVAGMVRCWDRHNKMLEDAIHRKAALEAEIKDLEATIDSFKSFI